MTTDNIKNLKGEVWNQIPWAKKYYVSNMGRVKSYKYHKARLLKQEYNSTGYLRVALSIRGKRKYYFIHRLVAEQFIDNDDPIGKNTVDHINGIKTDNRAENLRYLSLSQNMKEYYKRKNKQE